MNIRKLHDQCIWHPTILLKALLNNEIDKLYFKNHLIESFKKKLNNENELQKLIALINEYSNIFIHSKDKKFLSALNEYKYYYPLIGLNTEIIKLLSTETFVTEIKYILRQDKISENKSDESEKKESSKDVAQIENHEEITQIEINSEFINSLLDLFHNKKFEELESKSNKLLTAHIDHNLLRHAVNSIFKLLKLVMELNNPYKARSLKKNLQIILVELGNKSNNCTKIAIANIVLICSLDDYDRNISLKSLTDLGLTMDYVCRIWLMNKIIHYIKMQNSLFEDTQAFLMPLRKIFYKHMTCEMLEEHLPQQALCEEVFRYF